MKRCPQCNSVFEDDLSYCLNDGSVLTGNFEQETVVNSRQPNFISSQPPIKQGVSPIFAYLTFGLLALFIGGGLVAWLMSQKDLSQGDLNSESPSQTSDTKFESPQINKTPTVEKSPDVKELAPLTAELARNLINDWETAQNTKSFAKYRDCYDVSFRGIKRTVKGSVSNYNYSQWLADRQAMMKKTDIMKVRVDDLNINVQNNVAVAEFKQYFYVKGYADFGPKVIKIKMTENGAKIFFEELKSATLVTD